ncbi:hypothetical protein [Rickettsia endosymbiont of Cardiosporidium cionae]|uniref:hypothetical protein n=1 Tax=Rickettsia endosymbiont of Cardiosporidium cionae TaxID=2777155 RepID=UPI001893DCC1|nr:hypothetical protein [Rickettsia endosymbiont of Cardiosporidium cionae]KAF8818083.1 hypothetical protein IHI24_000882 [Rickettsia endosymbiont of Cardiosporidium cionae]
MSVVDDIRAIIAKQQTDSNIFHDIVHGNNTVIVRTEGGDINSIAKQLKGAFDRLDADIAVSLSDFELKITDLGTTLKASNDAVIRANDVLDNATGVIDSSKIFLDDTRAEIVAARSDLEMTISGATDDAIAAANQAVTSASEVKSLEATYGLSLPRALIGRAGSVLAVNPTEDGYVFAGAIPLFVGLFRNGSNLVFDSDSGDYNIIDYGLWTVAPPKVGFEIDLNGNLIMSF